MVILISDTPEVYYKLSFLVPLGDDIRRHTRRKFARMLHKKRYAEVLASITAMDYRCINDMGSVIRRDAIEAFYGYLDGAKICIMTSQKIVFEPLNWKIVCGCIYRTSQSYTIFMMRSKNTILVCGGGVDNISYSSAQVIVGPATNF